MKYYVSLEQNFIDLQSFLKQFINSGVFKLPLDYFNQKSQPPATFMAGNMLYVPLHIGWGQGGGVYGFCVAKVANKLGLLENHVKMMETEEDFKEADLKLSAQSLKMLKSVPANSKLFPENNNWQSRGFKCRAEDVVKAFAMGYMKVAESRALLEALCYSDYNLQHFLSDKRNSMAQVYAKLITYYTSGEKSSWASRHTAQRIVPHFERTNKVPDETCVIKWRKPNKSSKWPYTLDHHWFESQESPISLQHHTLVSLMGKNSNGNRESLSCNLPVFNNIRLLELCRKSVELFFTNLQKMISANTTEYGQYIGMVNDLEWPNGKYSNRRLTAEMFPVKACLALGVMPTFNHSGVFQKFVPIANKLWDNTKTLYYSIDPNTFTARRADVTLLLCYSAGLMNLEQLEYLLGPIGASSDVLKADPTKINLKLSNNVVCCMPMEAAHEKISQLLAKQGVVFRVSKASNIALSSISNSPNKEFEELDAENLEYINE